MTIEIHRHFFEFLAKVGAEQRKLYMEYVSTATFSEFGISVLFSVYESFLFRKSYLWCAQNLKYLNKN